MGGNIWCPKHTEITAEAVRFAHQLGIKVNAWTVDKPEDMARMIAYKVDGIITNHPDVLRGVLAEYFDDLPVAIS